MCSHSERRSLGRSALRAFALAATATACRTGYNYTGEIVPRFASGQPAVYLSQDGDQSDSLGLSTLSMVAPDSLRLVTYNIKYARRIDEAITVLTTDRMLQNADIVLLQEMDSAGTARIASTLDMAYVYYPATRHLKTRRDFGNAVLTRWPIVNDSRLTLPHHSRFTFTQRIATGVTIRVGHRLVRVYSAHLGTLLDISQTQRRDQLERIVADASLSPYVIIGGDMNSSAVGPYARQHGFTWLTARNARTTLVGRWDHFFTRGFDVRGEVPMGISKASRAASDHNAVWVMLPMYGPSLLWRWPGARRP